MTQRRAFIIENYEQTIKTLFFNSLSRYMKKKKNIYLTRFFIVFILKKEGNSCIGKTWNLDVKVRFTLQ